MILTTTDIAQAITNLTGEKHGFDSLLTQQDTNTDIDISAAETVLTLTAIPTNKYLAITGIVATSNHDSTAALDVDIQINDGGGFDSVFKYSTEANGKLLSLPVPILVAPTYIAKVVVTTSADNTNVTAILQGVYFKK